MTRRGETRTVAYGREHKRLRAELAPIVATGTVKCWRCHQLIEPGEPWDLGHNDDRTMTMGPEHRHRRPGCPGNRAVGWAKLRGQRRRQPTIDYGPRDDW